MKFKPAFLLFILSCSPIVDREYYEYLPMDRYTTYVYQDADGNTFVMNVLPVDTLFAVLDWEGMQEPLIYEDDFLSVYVELVAPIYGEPTVVFKGFVPYIPYPLVEGYERNFSFSGEDFAIRISMSVSRQMHRYVLQYRRYEHALSTSRIVVRKLVFAPDTGIVEALLDVDSIYVDGAFYDEPPLLLVLKMFN